MLIVLLCPPVAHVLSADECFIIITFRLLTFRVGGDIDRLHICSNKICGFNFIQTFFLTYYKSVFLSRLQSCSWNWRINIFFITHLFAPVSHFQAAVTDDSHVKFTWHTISGAAVKPTLFFSVYLLKNVCFIASSQVTRLWVKAHVPGRGVSPYQIYPAVENIEK